MSDLYSHQNSGVFQLAYELYEREELDEGEKHALRIALRWFEKNLPTPDRSRLNARAVFWFKPAAAEVARRVWDLADVVKRNGPGVQIIRTSRPGYVVYEDDLQVAAIPFRDTFQRS